MERNCPCFALPRQFHDQEQSTHIRNAETETVLLQYRSTSSWKAEPSCPIRTIRAFSTFKKRKGKFNSLHIVCLINKKKSTNVIEICLPHHRDEQTDRMNRLKPLVMTKRPAGRRREDIAAPSAAGSSCWMRLSTVGPGNASCGQPPPPDHS